MTCSNFYENLIKSKFKILDYNDPCYNFKSIKNSTEIKNTIKAHEKDGVALTKFLYWMKNSKERKSEISAQNILENIEKKIKIIYIQVLILFLVRDLMVQLFIIELQKKLIELLEIKISIFVIVGVNTSMALQMLLEQSALMIRVLKLKIFSLEFLKDT